MSLLYFGNNVFCLFEAKARLLLKYRDSEGSCHHVKFLRSTWSRIVRKHQAQITRTTFLCCSRKISSLVSNFVTGVTFRPDGVGVCVLFVAIFLGG
jgi:hypothetical protein